MVKIDDINKIDQIGKYKGIVGEIKIAETDMIFNLKFKAAKLNFILIE